jgi:hypothetical protein
MFKGKGTYLNEVGSNVEIASLCLTYLSINDLDTIFSTANSPEVDSQVVSGDLVLFEYAGQEWVSHVQAFCSKAGRSDAASVLHSHLETFFFKRQKDPPAVSNAVLPKEDFRAFRRYPEMRTQLAHSAWFKTALTSGALEQEGTSIAVVWLTCELNMLNIDR